MIRRMPKCLMPLFSIALAAACLIAFWLGGNLREGLLALALLGGVGVMFALGARSETIRGLRGDGCDEYWIPLTGTRHSSPASS